MKAKRPPSDATECSTKRKRYDQQLTTAAFCLAGVFFFSLLPSGSESPNVIWYEIRSWGFVAVPLVLSSFAFIHVLPVLLRGFGTQRISAAVLLIVAGYFAYQNWGAMMCNYVINR